LTTVEREQLAQLRRDNRELRLERDIPQQDELARGGADSRCSSGSRALTPEGPRAWKPSRLDARQARCYFRDTFGDERMATTTIKLANDLKERIAPLARAAGQTPHAWMVTALERQAELAGMREQFIAEAEASASEVDAGGALYAAEDVHAYILARAARRGGGRKPARPKAIKRRRA